MALAQTDIVCEECRNTFTYRKKCADRKDADYVEEWAYTYIENATENGIFEGYEDGSFKPEKQLTHEELTKVIISLMKDKLNDIPSDNLNDDIPNRDYWTNRWDNWSQPYLNMALNSGILNTNDTAYAYKNMLVSREDMSKIVILQKHLIKPIRTNLYNK